jgi:nucleoside-diphosphate-sugar epimerase
LRPNVAGDSAVTHLDVSDWFIIGHVVLDSLSSPFRARSSFFSPGTEAIFTPTGIALMNRGIHLDMSKVKVDLGYEPRFSLKQGLAATLAHLDI